MAKAAARELLPGQKRFGAGPLAADITLIAWFVFSLFPIIWMILLALKNDAQQTTTYFQFSPSWSNFATVLSDKGKDLTSVDFKTSLLTSLINCGGAVIVSLVVGIPAAYAAGRWKYRGSDDLMFQMLSFRFAPELMVIVPLFVIYNQIGLVRHQSRHDLGAAAGHDAVGGVDPALVLPGPAQRIWSRPPCWTVTPASGRS